MSKDPKWWMKLAEEMSENAMIRRNLGEHGTAGALHRWAQRLRQEGQKNDPPRKGEKLRPNCSQNS